MKCNGDCWNCEHDGCISLTTEDLLRQNKFDREEKSDRITPTPKQIRDRRYNRSEKARACKRRYLQTEKGRKKNLEQVKKYTQLHKEEISAYRKIYYEQNKELLREKRRQHYQEHREEILKRQKELRDRRKALNCG